MIQHAPLPVAFLAIGLVLLGGSAGSICAHGFGHYQSIAANLCVMALLGVRCIGNLQAIQAGVDIYETLGDIDQ
jgi:hypothetical protein